MPCWRLLLAIAPLFIGCGGRRTNPRFIVRDSAGVTLVDAVAPLSDRPGVLVDSTPEFDRGGGSDLHDEFPPDVRVVLLPDGRIVGFSVFDTAGRYGRGTVLSDPDQIGETSAVGWLRDGRLLLETYLPPRIGGLRRDSTLFRIGGPGGDVRTVLGRFPGVDQLIEFERNGYSMMAVPFFRQSYSGVLDSSIVIATNESFGFDRYGMDGQLVERVTRRSVRSPVSNDDVARWIDQLLARFPPNAEDRKARARRRFETAPRLPFKPFYDRLLVSPRGEVWLREAAPLDPENRATFYAIFDRSGRWSSRIPIPAGLDVRALGSDRLLGVVHDEDDAVHLRMYRLRELTPNR
jgi:hypothetical protein